MPNLKIPALPVVLNPSPDIARASPQFGMHASIRGESYEFVFMWNQKYGFYSLNITNRTRNRIKRITGIESNTPHDLKMFNPKDHDYPHATLLLQDITDLGMKPYPFLMGITHSVVVIPYGEVRV